MWVLFAEIWICLLLAFALGWFCHWFLLCRGKKEPETLSAESDIKDTENSE